MKEAITRSLAIVFKNDLDQWPHQFMTPGGLLIFAIPALAGLADAGIAGAVVWGIPLIFVMLLQRFFPI